MSILVAIYLGLAHVVGAGARALSPDKIAKEDRRDGLPFFLFILGLAGAFFTWFLAKDATAMGLNVVTFGLLFGRVSYALPVVLVIFAIYLMRNPSSTRNNGRIGIGLFLLLVSVIPSFIGEWHFNAKSYSLQRGWTPQRRELDYYRFIGASDETAKEVKLFGLSNFIIEPLQPPPRGGQYRTVIFQHYFKTISPVSR